MSDQNVKIFHTSNGILMGVHQGTGWCQSASRAGTDRPGHKVKKPVIVVVNGEGANMMAIYSLTESDEYFVPEDTMIYGTPMTPSSRLRETYLAKYWPQEEAPAMGLELSTSPRQG